MGRLTVEPAVERPSAGKAVLLLALVAIVVRLPGLNGGLWLDEIATLQDFIRLPLSQIVTTYGSPNNHVLYSVLGHASISAFGESAWSVRFPAFLFGFATVPAMYLLARQCLTEREAVGSALIMALSYHHVYFSQNARGYSGLLFFSVVSTWLLLRALNRKRMSHWVAYSVVAALNVYMLLTGLFVAVAQVAGAAIVHVIPAADASERRARAVGLFGAAALAALFTLILFAPMFGQMFTFYTTVEADFGWLPSDGLLAVVLSTSLPTFNPVILGLGASAGIPVLVCGVYRIARRMPLALFAFLVPPLIELVVTLLLGAGSSPRRFLLVLPAAAMIGVSGVHGVATWISDRQGRGGAGRAVFLVGMAAGILAMAAGLPRLYRVPKQDFEGALEFVAGAKRQGDIVAAAWIAVPPVQFFDPSVRSGRTVADLESILDEGRPVWLLATMLEELPRRDAALDDLIRRRFNEVQRFDGLVGDGAVVVLVSGPD